MIMEKLLDKAENNKPKRAKEEKMKNLLGKLKRGLKSVPKLVYGIVAALVTFIVVMLVMIFTPLNNSGDNGSSGSSYVKEINHSGNEKKKEREDTTKKEKEKKSDEKKADEKKDDKKVTTEEKTNTESVTNTENTSNVTNQPSENTTNNNAVEQPSVQKEKKPIYQTVHYDATGHWETQVISEAYDDPQFEERVVGISSGHIYDSANDFIKNGDLYGDGNYALRQVQVGSVHHDAVTTQVWVEDSPAHDEQVLVGWE